MSTPDPTPTAGEILSWAQEYLADLLGTEPAALDPHADFDQLGIDSALAVSLLMDIEGRYGVDLPPSRSSRTRPWPPWLTPSAAS